MWLSSAISWRRDQSKWCKEFFGNISYDLWNGTMWIGINTSPYLALHTQKSFPVLRLRGNPIGTCRKVMMTMTTSMTAHTSLWPVTTTTTTPKPSATSLMSTVSKLGDCYSQKANLTNQYGLQECPTKILLPPTLHAIVDLPVDDNQCHPNPFHAIEDPADDDVFSTYLTKWCNCTNEALDYLSELNAIVEACKCMQQWWPTAATMEPPTIQPITMTPTQQSPTPLMQWYKCDDKDFDFSLVIDKLIKACNRMQQQWPMVTTMAAPHHIPTKITPNAKWMILTFWLSLPLLQSSFTLIQMNDLMIHPPPLFFTNYPWVIMKRMFCKRMSWQNSWLWLVTSREKLISSLLPPFAPQKSHLTLLRTHLWDPFLGNC